MHPNLIKLLASSLAVVAVSLETQGVLPPGVATAIGTVLTYVAGLFHPSPGAGAK